MPTGARMIASTSAGRQSRRLVEEAARLLSRTRQQKPPALFTTTSTQRLTMVFDAGGIGWRK